MKFCSECGSANLNFIIPALDNRERFVCSDCEYIFYKNPTIVTGTIPIWDGKILLCRRNIEPRLGTWTLPAGFLELKESAEGGAIRESFEEAGCEVVIRNLFASFSVIHKGHVYLLYLADIVKPEFNFGHETSEVKLVTPEEIPWDDLSFTSVHFALRKYIESTDPYSDCVHRAAWDQDANDGQGAGWEP